MKAVWSAVLALSVAGAAYADDDDEAKRPARTYTQAEYEALLDLANRVLKLEELQQDAELEKLKAAAAREKQDEQKGLPERVSNLEKKMASAGQTYDASKMLTFATPDGNFTAKVAGRFYFVYRNVLDGNGAPATAAARDTFSIDTARIRVEGSFYKDFFYQIETEGKSGTPAGQNGAFTLNEAWLSWRGLGDWVALTAGLTKVPVSQEETTSSRFIDFAERSVLNRITPGRDIQLTLNGALFDKIVEWWAGMANGNVNRETQKLTLDKNDEKDYFVRLFVTPMKTSDMNLLKQMRFGIDACTGERDNPNDAIANVSSGDFGLPAILTFTPGANVIRGDQTRVHYNFSWLVGPWSLRAEYGRVRSDIAGGIHDSFIQRGWYVTSTYLLTGEDKALENRVKPKNNFDPLGGGWGAWELALRWAVIASNAPAMNLGNGQSRTTEYTVGVNWWMTPNVALRLNWERFIYDDDVAVGKNGALKRYEDCIYIRWQIDF